MCSHPTQKKNTDDSTTETSRYILRPEALEGAEKTTHLSMVDIHTFPAVWKETNMDGYGW